MTRSATRTPAVRARRLLTVTVLLAAVGPAACSDAGDVIGTRDDAALTMDWAADPPTVGYSGLPLDEPLAIRVMDRAGQPAPGVIVAFGVTHGGGTLSRYAVATDADGVASTRWTLGRTVGDQAVTARVEGVGALPVSVVAAEGETVGLRAGNGQTGAVGSELPEALSVLVVDAFGQPVSGTPVSWSVTSGGGSVADSVTATDAEGVARTVWTLGPTTGANGARARVGFGMVDFTATALAGQPSEVRVRPGFATLGVGEDVSLSAAAVDRFGNPVAAGGFVWSSSDPGVVEIEAGTGRATGVSVGTTTLVASSGNVTGSATVTVVAPGVALPGVVGDLQVVGVIQNAARLEFTQVDDGTGAPARYEVRYGSPTIGWSAAAATARTVAGTSVGAPMTVDLFGLSPATTYQFQLQSFRADGSVAGSLSNIATATTAGTGAGTPSVASVTVSPSTVSLTSLGAQTTLSPVARTAAGAVVGGVAYNYQSLNPSVAQVTAGGVVTAQSVGTAQIRVTAACCSVSATATITVSQVPAGISVSPSSAVLAPNASRQFSATVTDARGNAIPGQGVSWTVANTAVATVNPSTGVVTAGANQGSTQVRASNGLLVGTGTVTVSTGPAPTGATFEETWNFTSTEQLFAQSSARYQFPIWANQGGFLELATDQSTPWGGSTAIRTHWGGGPYPGGGDEQVGIDVLLPSSAQATEVWVEVYLRYSPNFRVLSDHKTMFVFEEDGSRWEMRFGAHRVRAQAKIDNVDVKIATDASGREIDVTNPVLVWDGSWHVLRLHLRTGGGGRFRTWLDGNLLIDEPVSNGASRFNRVALGRNGDPAEPSDLYWGRLLVHTSNPGW